MLADRVGAFKFKGRGGHGTYGGSRVIDVIVIKPLHSETLTNKQGREIKGDRGEARGGYNLKIGSNDWKIEGHQSGTGTSSADQTKP